MNTDQDAIKAKACANPNTLTVTTIKITLPSTVIAWPHFPKSTHVGVIRNISRRKTHCPTVDHHGQARGGDRWPRTPEPLHRRCSFAE